MPQRLSFIRDARNNIVDSNAAYAGRPETLFEVVCASGRFSPSSENLVPVYGRTVVSMAEGITGAHTNFRRRIANSTILNRIVPCRQRWIFVSP